MPNRLIRDGLLESEAVLSLPVEARWLYLSILLSADDVGLFEATPFRLARRADIRRELADKLVQMLADSDLIRLYRVDGKAYGFVPKYGQRIQIQRAKYPIPPGELLHGDDDAINKINNLGLNPRLTNGGARKTTVGQPPEVEVEVEVEKTKPRTSKALGVPPSPPAPTALSGKPSRKPREDKPAPPSAAVWEAYSNAYQNRYGVPPVRNASVNAHLAQVIGRLGADEAPAVAVHFVGSQNGLYVAAMHPTNLLLRDAEKLRTEWATGRNVTRTQAMMADKTQTNFNAFAPLIAAAEAREAAERKSHE